MYKDFRVWLFGQRKEKRYSLRIEDCKLEIFIFEEEPEGETVIDNMMHTHSFAELFYCLNGSIQLNLPDNKIMLNKNDVAIIPCGLIHTKYTHPSENAVWGGMELICSKIKQTGEILEEVYNEIAPILYGGEILICRDNEKICSCMDKLKENAQNNTLQLLEFAYNLYKISKDNDTEKVTLTRENNSQNIDRLIIIDRILNTEYMHNFSNEEIAHQLCIGKRQLSRFVLKNYGYSFHELIKKRRISAASTQLADTEQSIEAICYSVGFSNKTAFYNYFKKEYGITPAEYRKLRRSNSKPFCKVEDF